MELESRHQCLIYEGPPSQQLPALAAMIRHKLDDGYRCLYLNSKSMVAGLRSCISAIGVDVASEVDRGRLILSSDASPTREGSFDTDAMLMQLEQTLDQALADGFN